MLSLTPRPTSSLRRFLSEAVPGIPSATPAQATSWLPFTRKTNWWQLTQQPQRSSLDIHCQESRARTASLDAANHLAFIAGEENHKLAVVDLTTMTVQSVHNVGEDPDVLAFDPGLKQLYVSAESGNITVFREEGKSLTLAGKVFLPHGHTVSVDPDTHLVYFPLQNLDGHPVLRIMAPVH